MKASKVRLSMLETFTDHETAIQQIEGDPQNTVGGIKAWNSGRETFLTEGATKKIELIRQRQDKLFPTDDD